MKSTYLFVLLISLFLISCDKDETELKATCVEAKYVGMDCWPIIQITNSTEPSFDGFWNRGDTTYQNCVIAVDLPEDFKDGEIFSFTVTTVDSTFTRTTNCFAPKYSIGMNNRSHTSCKQVER